VNLQCVVFGLKGKVTSFECYYLCIVVQKRVPQKFYAGIKDEILLFHQELMSHQIKAVKEHATEFQIKLAPVTHIRMVPK